MGVLSNYCLTIYKIHGFVRITHRAGAFGAGEEAAGLDAGPAEEGIRTGGFDRPAVASETARRTRGDRARAIRWNSPGGFRWTKMIAGDVSDASNSRW